MEFQIGVILPLLIWNSIFTVLPNWNKMFSGLINFVKKFSGFFKIQSDLFSDFKPWENSIFRESGRFSKCGLMTATFCSKVRLSHKICDGGVFAHFPRISLVTSEKGAPLSKGATEPSRVVKRLISFGVSLSSSSTEESLLGLETFSAFDTHTD